MKMILTLILILLGIIMSCNSNSTNITECETQDEYSNPSCVIYDYENNRYLVSNRGNGTIIEEKRDGCRRVVIDSLSQPKGLLIMDETLLIVENNKIKGFNLNELSEQIIDLSIPNAGYLCGIIAIENEIFVTDIHRNLVFKINYKTLQYEIFVSSGLLSPIGIVINEDSDELIIVSGAENSPIYSVNPVNGDVSTILESDFNYYDFITQDINGNYYVSCWGTNTVYRYSSDFTELEIFSTGHNGPAGIFYNKSDNTLVVPNFETNTLDFFGITR